MLHRTRKFSSILGALMGPSAAEGPYEHYQPLFNSGQNYTEYER